jgi:hypothetical protein
MKPSESSMNGRMNAFRIEARFFLDLPESHIRALSDPSDPIHEYCCLLLPESQFPHLRLEDVNIGLHDARSRNPWPEHLVAFASNGGGYFAYDLSSSPPRVLHIDAQRTVGENLELSEKYRLTFSFDEWREVNLATRNVMALLHGR